MKWPPVLAWLRVGRVGQRRVTAAGLALAALVSVVCAQREQGIARDEVLYMAHGTRYARWWIDLCTFENGTVSERRITATFGGSRATDNNREHPPLMKTLFGLSRILFHEKLGWASELTASRLPTALMNALAVVLCFWFGAAVWGYSAGLLAAILVLLLPRAFFHAQLATFDAPMVALWLATLFAYFRALASRRWCAILAVAFGLALATKHNALLLPGVIVPHYLWLAWRRGARRAGAGAGLAARLWSGVREVGRVRPLVFAGLAAGPLVLFAVWPWLWFDTVEHVRDWIAFHLDHVHYNFEYLGDNYNHPPFPWHVALVTTLFTVPVATVAAAATGAVHLAVRARRGKAADPDRAPALLLALSAAVAMGVFVLGTTPIFGAEKHWAPAIPTLCLFAGVGVVAAAERFSSALSDRRWLPSGLAVGRLVRVGAVSGLGALVATAALAETVRAHPYALSHYNALAGGAAGGADLGMNRQFWGYAARGVLPWVDRLAPPAGAPPVPVYTHDASPAWPIYKRLEWVARGLPDAGRERRGIARSKVALVVHERHFLRHDLLIWREYGTVRPTFVLTTDGVPIVSVYVRPGLRSARGL